MFSTVAGPCFARGWMWWNSRKVRSEHLRPVGETKAHWPASRRQTTRLTSRRDIARVRRGFPGGSIRPRTDRRTRMRPRRRPELLLLNPLEQQRQSAVEDHPGIAVRDLAP